MKQKSGPGKAPGEPHDVASLTWGHFWFALDLLSGRRGRGLSLIPTRFSAS